MPLLYEFIVEYSIIYKLPLDFFFFALILIL